jgi:N-acetylglucosamine-6-phosphate deacetylase
MKYITGGKIITPEGISEGRVLAYNDRICGLVDAETAPAGADVIDAHGQYVSPGFVDIHIHGYMQADVSDGKADGIRIRA